MLGVPTPQVASVSQLPWKQYVIRIYRRQNILAIFTNKLKGKQPLAEFSVSASLWQVHTASSLEREEKSGGKEEVAAEQGLVDSGFFIELVQLFRAPRQNSLDVLVRPRSQHRHHRYQRTALLGIAPQGL